MINWKRYPLLIFLFTLCGFISGIAYPWMQGVRGAMLGFMLALCLPLSGHVARRFAAKAWYVGYGFLLLALIPLGLGTGALLNYVATFLPHYSNELFNYPILDPHQTFLAGALHFVAFNYICLMLLRRGLPAKIRYLFGQLLLIFVVLAIAICVIVFVLVQPFNVLAHLEVLYIYPLISVFSWLPFYLLCLLTLNYSQPFTKTSADLNNLLEEHN